MSDGGTEYKNKDVQAMLTEQGASFSYSPPHLPQFNGTAERLNRTLLNYARTLIIDSKLRREVWAEAINYSAFVQNCVKFIEAANKTPFELVMRERPYLRRLKPFGTRCFFYDRRPNRHKLAARAKEGAIVGIEEDGRSYRVLELGTSQIYRVPDIIVKKEATSYESAFHLPPEPPQPPSQEEEPADEQTDASEAPVEAADELPTPNFSHEKDGELPEGFNDDRTVDDELGLQPEEEPEPARPRTSHPRTKEKKSSAKENKDNTETRGRKLRDRSRISKPDMFGDWEALQASSIDTNIDRNSACVGNNDDYVPNNFREVNTSRHRSEWWAAMNEEMASIDYHHVWDLVKPPPNKKILGCRWIFTEKRDKDGKISRRKARLCLKGFAQKPGIDFTEVFSPVARFESTLRSVLAIAARERLVLY